MQQYFERLADAVCTLAEGAERVTLSFSAEATDFIRFNRAAVRQATHVEQRYGSVSVIADGRRATGTLSLRGELGLDIQALLAERATLLAQLPHIPQDRYLLLPSAIASSQRRTVGELPAAGQLIDAVSRHAAGTDMVGFYAGGPVVRAYADSRGQRNWHEVDSFLFEWSLYRSGDQAVKSSYAGSQWSEAQFAARMAQARAQCELLGRARKTLAPGDYRVYLSPVAVGELLGTLSWGGFGLKAVNTGVSTLIQLHRGEAALHKGVTLTEATAGGIAPSFQDDGFVKPDAVPLVAAGRIAGTLAAPRSAMEYGVAANGSGPEESPESLAMAAGTLPPAEALKALGTGVYVSNLHYLNYSDRQACRMTGMTRFACFWVENGELAAPIDVMRFDDSFIRMFGSGLVALTDSVELLPDNATYGARQLRSISAPGAIVEGLRFTL
ncbi:TldD/PmbA family protein [Caenimonas terrae]|uniref:TldD/PmbA family protein n=1 Tax=Caenimonas terrae TaxID=696074 RepID=A0ABW0NKJ1_9BURK